MANAISNAMVLVITYDQPITDDTVRILKEIHQDDEGVLRVTGSLLS